MIRLFLPLLLLAMPPGAIAGNVAGDLPKWLADSTLASEPAGGLRDDSGFLARNPDAAGRIRAEIAALRASHKFRLVLIVESVLLTSTPQEVATLLQLDWFPNGDGLVVVYESDSRRLGFSRDLVSRFGNNPGRLTIPSAAMDEILARAREAVVPSQEPDQFLEELVVRLTRELDGYFHKLKAPPAAGSRLRVALLVVGGLAGVALAAIALAAFHRLPANRSPRVFRFPVVDRPERLGAPCGGGHVVSRRFRAP